jgi:tryptophan halogenase
MESIAIVGSGTAGLINALILRKAFPLTKITVISSSSIGIIGVGEGSTEHWKIFMDICDIPLGELLIETKATHKNGIRFENWTNHTPDYFHSVSNVSTLTPFNVYALYNGLIKDAKLLTENTASRAMIENKVRVNGMHRNVNQYHFDTYKLNDYLVRVCINRNIEFIDAAVTNVVLCSKTGNIETVNLDNGESFSSGFWIDATGLARILISKVSEAKWVSFSDYLLMDSAIAFPTDSDPSGEIRPYTRARAASSGWMWEIPTQERRGNGYVYSSSHISDDDAIKEASVLVGLDVEPRKSIKFNPGYLKEMWVKNCVAVGLASAFVEPIEATSIGGTIQQARCLVENISTYRSGHTEIQKTFNAKMESMMENILCMISLHYISDRDDTQFWKDISNTKKPEKLISYINLWKERPPVQTDFSGLGYELFHAPHFYHVAHGQGLINKEMSFEMLKTFNLLGEANKMVHDAKLAQSDHERIDHARSLKELQI